MYFFFICECTLFFVGTVLIREPTSSSSPVLICEASLQNLQNVAENEMVVIVDSNLISLINYNNLLNLKCDCSKIIHLKSYFLYEKKGLLYNISI